MHYYKKNIGDYAKKTGRLSMLQHGAYTLLIDSCYDREVFPTLDQALEWTWASSKEEIEAVEFVLKRFFVLQEDGTYTQKRIEEELNNYHAVSETNKRIALEREAKRRGNSTKRGRSVHEAPPNQEPLTKNQEPVKEKNTKKRKIFKPPTLDQVRAYCAKRNNNVDPEQWMDHYTSNGWKVGKNPMKDWMAAVRTWERNNKEQNNGADRKPDSRAKRVSNTLDRLAAEAIERGEYV